MSCAGVLTIAGPPVTPRLVKGKAFQEVIGRDSPAAPPCLGPRNTESWQENLAVLVCHHVFSHTRITEFCASRTGPGSCSESLLYLVARLLSRAGIPLELQDGRPVFQCPSNLPPHQASPE